MADKLFDRVVKKLEEEEKKFRPEIMSDLAYEFNKSSNLEKHVKYIEQGLLLKVFDEQNKILILELKEAIEHIYNCC